MFIYNPYFYIIQDTRNGMYYAGAKWGKDANPNNLMIEGGYTTSSSIIKEIISRFGLDIFIVRKIKTFKTANEAFNYETKFLQKIDAKRNPKFYNGHNNNGCSAGTQQYEEKMLKKYGVDHNMKVPEIQESRKSAIINKWGSYSNMLIETGAIEKSSKTCELRYGTKYAFFTEAAIKRREEVSIEKYGVKHHFQSKQLQAEMKEKGKKTFAKNYNKRQEPIIEKLKHCNIDFSKHGWVTQASKIIGITPQKVCQWMKRNMLDFYEQRCFKRKSNK